MYKRNDKIISHKNKVMGFGTSKKSPSFFSCSVILAFIASCFLVSSNIVYFFKGPFFIDPFSHIIK